MKAAPKFRNFQRHDYLTQAPIAKAWDRDELRDLACGAYENRDFILLHSPTNQWVYAHDPLIFGPKEFCDWIECVTGVPLVDRDAFPDLRLAAEPREDWTDAALDMPCRSGIALWDKLSAKELHTYVQGGGLPDDVDTRGEPDKIQ